MAKPLYFRSSNPNLSNVIAKASNIFEWDESGSMPTELVNGKGVMPPQSINGETVIWSDSYTLGYTDAANATPLFFSDNAVGATKVLEMINHVAGRLNQNLFADLPSAKTWIATVSGVYFAEPNSGINMPNRTYKLNPSLNGLGQIMWNDGSINYSSGSPTASTQWPDVSGLTFSRYDAYGNDHLTTLQNANKVAFYVDENNYVKWDASLLIALTNLDGHPTVWLNLSNIQRVGLRPPQPNGTIDPGLFTLFLGSEVNQLS